MLALSFATYEGYNLTLGRTSSKTMYHQAHPIVELTQRPVSFANLHCTDVSFIDTLLTLHGGNLAKWSGPRPSNFRYQKNTENFRPLIALFAILMDPREFVGSCIAQTNIML